MSQLLKTICEVILVVFYCTHSISDAIVRNEDICGAHNGRRLYLELGEQGILYAKNVSFIKNAPRLQTSRIYSANSSYDQCSLELVTCPSCIITLTFKSIALSQHCGDGVIMLDNPCRCDYVWLSEPPYEDVSGTPFCDLYSLISYRSNTRTLSITLLYSQSYNHAFTLEYTAERNRLHLKSRDLPLGLGKPRNNTTGGILTSPFFPARYPRDLGMEYIITCLAETPSCRVRVLFSDFQLAAVSIMEFYDFNGQRLDVSSGASFRPPVIVSSGPSLLIRFYANGGTGLGYKAFYSFVFSSLYDKSIQPITDCGGYVENLGGAITMMDMVDQGIKIYDCVWLIRPPKTFLHMKTHIYFKIITFDDMAGNTELVIKQGPTSALLPLEILRHPASKLQPRRLKEHVAPISNGFHVSLRGTFGPTSHLALAYAAFSYTDCFTGSDFLCQNHRCISNQLNCDGFDHCGDNSDEPATCTRDWDMQLQDKKWHTNKANYYFPKIDRYPDLKTATLVFVASSLGLIILISALIILLYKVGARARQQRELQSRLQTISELLDGARLDDINVADDPPVYESPPGYDEVVKLGYEIERSKRKKKKSNSNDLISRSCTSQSSSDYEAHTSVNVLSDSGASTSRSCQYVPVADRNVQQVISESPPPPYVTPPGTISRDLNLLGSFNSTSSEADSISDQGHRMRHCWIRNSEEFSNSVPTSEERPPECLTSFNDAESLGAYLQNYAANPSEFSAPQLSNWTNASMDINPEYDERSKDAEEVADVMDVTGDRKDLKTCSCQETCECIPDDSKDSSSLIFAQKIAADKTETPSSGNEKEPIIPSDTAAMSPLISSVLVTLSITSPVVTSLVTVTASTVTSAVVAAATALLPSTSSSSTNTENVIVKFFGNSKLGKRSLRSMSLNSITFSTASSSLCSTLDKSYRQNGFFRKLSICSRDDSYITKISALSASSSYEKLQDNFDVASEPTSMLELFTRVNTSVNASKIVNKKTTSFSRPCNGRYLSCDLESLNEGIKIFDSFLDRHEMDENYSKNSLMTVMLFGTPKHTHKSARNIYEHKNKIGRKPFWRSIDDNWIFGDFRNKE